jgi:branched-chain amino acid transport system substrate-binding protein
VFSLSGGADVYGPQQVRGAELAVAQVNATGGVAGRKLDLKILNDASNPTKGVADFRQLAGPGRAVAILGPTLSDVAVKADPVADRLRVPVMGVSDTAPGIVGKCPYPCTFIWRDALGEATAIPEAISFALGTVHSSSAATVEVTGDMYSVTDAGIAAAAFKGDGVHVTRQVTIPDRSTNLGAYAAEVVASGASIVFVTASAGSTAAAFVNALEARGFTGQVIGGDSFDSSATARLLASGSAVLNGASWSPGNNFPANTAFIASYQRAFGTAPDEVAARSYTGVLIVAQAIRNSAAAGSSSAPWLASGSLSEQRSALQASMSTVALTTPLGPFRFTSAHVVSQATWIVKISASSGQQLVGFCDPGC